MPKKAMEVLTETMFYVLMAFMRGEMCGIEIADFIDEKTNGRLLIGPATLYTILGKYEKEKLIELTAVEGRKRTYRILPKGIEAYEEEYSRLRLCLADALEEEEMRKEKPYE
ncbi:MAG: PadR family transcriptional regulator [Eubacteriaceae bacterium]|nr:PadR family transcriptional regulator [Eubacteriaceae bacterium]